LGHAACGGVSAFANKTAPLSKRDFIGKWMSQISQVAERVDRSKYDEKGWIQQLEWAVVDYSLDNLMTFPAVREAVEAGELTLHGAYFGVATGVLFIKNTKTGKSEPYSEAA